VTEAASRAASEVDVKIGVVYPQIELGGRPEAVRAVGQAVVDGGFDHLVAYDHVLGAVHDDRTPPLTGPYTERDPFHDPLVMFAYLAGRHPDLAFATGILILPQRQTALVARQAADLALLTGGRFRLGVGTGWNPVEYEALGIDFGGRGARLDEQIGVLRDLWRGGVVDIDTGGHRIDRAALVPAPDVPPEVWIGGWSAPAHRRAARLGDGFVFAGPRDVTFRDWDRLRAMVEDEGRSIDDFGGEYLVFSRTGPDDVAEKFGQWADRGGTHAAVVTMGLGLDSADAHVDYIGRISELVRGLAEEP
jgi:probable F420-dependent oxidoreductase